MVGGESSATMTLGSEDRIMTWCSALNIYKVVSYFSLLVFVYYVKGYLAKNKFEEYLNFSLCDYYICVSQYIM